MIQADVVICYGLGSVFALSHARHVPPVSVAARRDPRLAGVVLCTSFVVSPVVLLMMWRYPGWETMWVVSAPPVWLLVAMVPGLNLFATAGYLSTRALLGRGSYGAACAQWHASVFGTVFVLFHGWDGTGYQRFLSPTAQDFAQWGQGPVPERVLAWLVSPVPWLMATLTALTVAGCFFLVCRCDESAEVRCAAREHGWLAVRPVVSAAFVGCVVAAVGFSGVVRWAGWPEAVLVLMSGVVALGMCGFSAPWYAPLDPRLRPVERTRAAL
ncbi:hypothetical protein OG302_42945 [Streptomyces sp. NBC_01283]|uniref:hypothetical protein n=1 Tax=Streptomyces sp. NBC_01283 TaxID=2903812 RepID=UPI00352EC2C8|nr:hypothetical protein OG302_42945 [Streptomyces sp. NBC_01283]